jgi:hypothetical protein
MRRAATRTVLGLVVVLVLTTFFTAGGVSLLAAGQLPGLPLAVGGAVLQLTLIVVVIAVLRVRSTLDGHTVARSALVAARRTAVAVRRTALLTLAALLLYGLVRLVFGDRATLVTSALIGIALWTLSVGANRLRKAQDQSVSQRS